MDRPALRKLLSGFRFRMDQIVPVITAAGQDAPLAEVAEPSHEGAGAAAVIGETGIQRQFAAIEAACNAGERPALHDLARGLPDAWQEVRQSLDAHCSEND